MLPRVTLVPNSQHVQQDVFFQNRENPMTVRMKFISTGKPCGSNHLCWFSNPWNSILLLNKLKQIEEKKFVWTEHPRHIFSCFTTLISTSHMTLAQDGCPHHVIHASCAVFVLISLRLSTLHSSPSLSSSVSFSWSSSSSSMWVGSVRSTLCASANEELGTLADNNPLTVRRSIEQFESHPNRNMLLKDFEKSEEINHFSQESKDLTTEMGNNEIFEVCEISSKRQCPDCAWNGVIGFVYCTCWKCMQPTAMNR